MAKKYETVYPNTIKYEPKVKTICFEIYGKNYKVNTGLRNLMRIQKVSKQIEDDPEIMFDILDMMFFKGFCDEIEAIEPNFPFDDLMQDVMDAIAAETPEALKGEGDIIEATDDNVEPKKG